MAMDGMDDSGSRLDQAQPQRALGAERRRFVAGRVGDRRLARTSALAVRRGSDFRARTELWLAARRAASVRVVAAGRCARGTDAVGSAAKAHAVGAAD